VWEKKNEPQIREREGQTLGGFWRLAGDKLVIKGEGPLRGGGERLIAANDTTRRGEKPWSSALIDLQRGVP